VLSSLDRERGVHDEVIGRDPRRVKCIGAAEELPAGRQREGVAREEPDPLLAPVEKVLGRDPSRRPLVEADGSTRGDIAQAGRAGEPMPACSRRGWGRMGFHREESRYARKRGILAARQAFSASVHPDRTGDSDGSSPF
jgi:hypothetical protein